MLLPLIHSLQIDATIVIANKVDIKAESTTTTATRLDSVTSATSASSVGKKDAAPGSILNKSRMTKRLDSSLGTSADSIPDHPTLVGALTRAIGSMLLTLRVISTTWKTLLVPYLSTIMATKAVRRKNPMVFQPPLSLHQSILSLLILRLILLPLLRQLPLLQ
jgi:hypothetical protein